MALILSGIFLGPLVKKYGCRIVCCCGALLVTAAYCVTFIGPSLPIMFITFGVLPGKILQLYHAGDSNYTFRSRMSTGQDSSIGWTVFFSFFENANKLPGFTPSFTPVYPQCTCLVNFFLFEKKKSYQLKTDYSNTFLGGRNIF